MQRRPRPSRGRVRIGVTLVALVVTAACGGGGDDGGSAGSTSASAPSTAPVSAAARTVVPKGCSWPVKADVDTLNVAYPDTSATYWATRYVLAPGSSLVIAGTLPEARYASFIAYDATGTPVDSVPDTGFGADAASGTYSLSITPGTPEPGDAALAAGPATAAAPVEGTVIYRVYLPADPEDPKGGVSLPSISVEADGSKDVLPPCPKPGPSPEAEARIAEDGPATDRPAPPTPIFIRPATVANLFPNPDNTYLATILAHRPGRVAVVTGRAPTVPDTNSGEARGADAQLRFWSMCTDEYRKPYPVSSCVPDDEVAVSPEGTYTFVISTSGDRPANATEADGVTWLDWGSTEVDNLLLLRQMLPASDFAGAAANVAPGALASTTMGEYTPRGAYCTTAEFEQGAAACTPSGP